MLMRPSAKNPLKMAPSVKKVHNQLTQELLPLSYKLQDMDLQKMKSNTPLGNTLSLPFQIERSHTGNLPVYTDFKSKRTGKFTVLRKITGDVDALEEELKKVTSNSTIEQKAGRLVITGMHQQALNIYLHRLGF